MSFDSGKTRRRSSFRELYFRGIKHDAYFVGTTSTSIENKNDLELDFKVFFFIDSCCLDIVHDESK